MDSAFREADRSQKRGSAANSSSREQRNDVRSRLEAIGGMSVWLSNSGGSDKPLTHHAEDDKSTAGADGEFEYDGYKGMIYLRWTSPIRHRSLMPRK